MSAAARSYGPSIAPGRPLLTSTTNQDEETMTIQQLPFTHNFQSIPSNAETVAVYLDLALRWKNGRYPDLPASGWTPWLDDERVVTVIFFALDGYPGSWGHTNWLVLNEKGGVLDAYAFHDLLSSMASSRYPEEQ